MQKPYNKRLVSNSQKLRKNMTKEERHLWYDFLIGLPVTVNRQKAIGNYIVDFYCSSAKLAIELDGSQHYLDFGTKQDKERDKYLNSLGIRVVRYSNSDINLRFNAVCMELMQLLNLDTKN
jgi:very-short-patch-repair endonuclease